MNYFLNLQNGKASISSSRLVNASATDVDDIVSSYESSKNETLTASLDLWIKEELSKLDLSLCNDIEDARNTVFGEWDFLELTLNQLDVDVCDYPDLRDYQHDFINEHFE